MALPKEDHWIAVAGLGAVAFGYWYYKSHSSSSTSTSSSTSADTSTSDQTGGILIPSYDLQADNVVNPSQVYYQQGSSGTTGPGSDGGTSTTASNPTEPQGTGLYSTPTAPGTGNFGSTAMKTTATSGQAMTLPVNG